MFFKQNTSFIKGFIILFPATILHVHQVISSQNVFIAGLRLIQKGEHQIMRYFCRYRFLVQRLTQLSNECKPIFLLLAAV